MLCEVKLILRTAEFGGLALLGQLPVLPGAYMEGLTQTGCLFDASIAMNADDVITDKTLLLGQKIVLPGVSVWDDSTCKLHRSGSLEV